MIITMVLMLLFLVSYGVNGLLLRFLRTLGTKDQTPSVQVRWSTQAKPTIGGISFLIGFLLSLSIGLLMADPTNDHRSFMALLVAAVSAFGMGLADDAFNTRPFLKFIAQVACGALLASGGVLIDSQLGSWVDYLFTIFWTVTMMNSLNMLDNMDGVSGGVALSIFAGIWCLLPIHDLLSWVAIGMVMTLMGFLWYNWHPSTLFMGDSGSQIIGVLVAALSLEMVSSEHLALTVHPSVMLLSLVLMTFTTLCDTALVVVNRMIARRSPFIGGRDHSSHNLSYLGFGDGAIAFTFTFWSALNVIMAMSLLTYEGAHLLRWELGIMLYMLVLFISFFFISRRNIHKGKYAYQP